METHRIHTEKLRLKLAHADGRVAEINAPGGGRIGHILSGQPGGPNLLVAGTGRDVDAAFQYLLREPGLNAMRCRLVLLRLDELPDQEVQLALSRVARIIQPVADTLFLHAQTADGPAASRSQIELMVRSVLNFCEKNGAIDATDRGDAPSIRDFAS